MAEVAMSTTTILVLDLAALALAVILLILSTQETRYKTTANVVNFLFYCGLVCLLAGSTLPIALLVYPRFLRMLTAFT
jgi:hypothetical protein